jgi:Ca-activated chloride channel family protein
MAATETAVARVDLIDQATGEIHPTTVVGEAQVDLPAGRYRLTVDPETGGRIEFRDLVVSAGTERAVELDLGPAPAVALDVGSDSVISGTPMWIDVAGGAPPGARLQFVDAAGAAVSRSIDPNDDEGWLDTPTVVGPLELLLIGPEANGVGRVIARRPVTVASGDPGLTAPEEIAIGEDVVVGWTRLVGGDDIVGMVPRDGTATELISCITAAGRIEGSLSAPTVAAELDVVVVDGVTLAVVARRPIRITAPKATVNAPERVAIGDRIEVAWLGPEGREDFVSLALPGSPDLDYLEWARVEDGNPTVFRAPRTPGEYELRYVDGEAGVVRARAPIIVTGVAVELSAPATATAGLRFEVVWSGPAAPGDIITLSKPGSAPSRYLDWASITVGSPLTLAAPDNPGTYEIRYLARGSLEILGHIVIKVRR